MIIWTGTHSATMSGPNDEAISEHRLYDRGLKDALWAGRVHDSRATHDLARMKHSDPHRDSSPVGSLTHHVLPLKEAVVEVIAQSFTIARAGDTTAEAAITTLRGGQHDRPRKATELLYGCLEQLAPVLMASANPIVRGTEDAVRALLASGEPGVGLEILVSNLYEDGISVPPSTKVQLLTAADLMGMPTGDVEALAT